MRLLFSIIIGIAQLFRPKDWKVTETELLEGEQIQRYWYNGRRYRWIGTTVPRTIRRGFFIPIQKVEWNGQDVTSLLKEYSGPRNDFYNQDPRLDLIFKRVTGHRWRPRLVLTDRISLVFDRVALTRPVPGTLKVTNILGHTSVFGAK